MRVVVVLSLPRGHPKMLWPCLRGFMKWSQGMGQCWPQSSDGHGFWGGSKPPLIPSFPALMAHGITTTHPSGGTSTQKAPKKPPLSPGRTRYKLGCDIPGGAAKIRGC